jgi:hypothetical protein
LKAAIEQQIQFLAAETTELQLLEQAQEGPAYHHHNNQLGDTEEPLCPPMEIVNEEFLSNDRAEGNGVDGNESSEKAEEVVNITSQDIKEAEAEVSEEVYSIYV